MPEAKTKTTVLISVTVSPELRDAAREEAHRRWVSVSYLIRRAIMRECGIEIEKGESQP